MLKKLNKRGDTIVEVLIAITIISFMLASGFVIANQGIAEERQAEERAEALQIVQSQIEAIRAAVNSSQLDLSKWGAGTMASPYFCMVGLTATVSTNSACLVDSSGNATTGQPGYRLTTSVDPLTPGYNVLVKAYWDQFGGGTENVTLAYRIYSLN